MKNKLSIAFGIIALFLGNTAFATGPSNPGESKNANPSLFIVAQITIDQIEAERTKRSASDDDIKDVERAISSLENDIHFVDSCKKVVQDLRAKIKNSAPTIKGEISKIHRDNNMSAKEKRNAVRKRNHELAKNRRMIPKLTELDEKLQGDSDDLKVAKKNAYAEKQKLSAHK